MERIQDAIVTFTGLVIFLGTVAFVLTLLVKLAIWAA